MSIDTYMTIYFSITNKLLCDPFPHVTGADLGGGGGVLGVRTKLQKEGINVLRVHHVLVGTQAPSPQFQNPVSPCSECTLNPGGGGGSKISEEEGPGDC